MFEDPLWKHVVSRGEDHGNLQVFTFLEPASYTPGNSEQYSKRALPDPTHVQKHFSITYKAAIMMQPTKVLSMVSTWRLRAIHQCYILLLQALPPEFLILNPVGYISERIFLATFEAACWDLSNGRKKISYAQVFKSRLTRGPDSATPFTYLHFSNHTFSNQGENITAVH